MRICYVCNEYPPAPCGGIGTITQTLARAMHKRGHSVRVIGNYPHDHRVKDYEEDQGVRVWRFRSRLGRGAWIRDRWRMYRQLSIWARAQEIDLIEIPDWSGVAAGWNRLPVPLVTRIHGSIGFFQAEMKQPLDRLARFLENASLRRSDSCCAVSQYAANKMRSLYRISRPIEVLYNPIFSHTATEDVVDRDRHKVVFAGTLAEKKGVISLIRAWKRILATVPDAKLHVFGRDGKAPSGGSMREFLQTQLPDQARQSVHFYGHQPRAEVERALRSAWVAVYPSYAESFGAAPLEAMACGCATIYSRCGPGPELVRDGSEALLVDPAQPDEIAEAVIRVLTVDDLSHALGDAGAKCIKERFSPEILIEKNIAFYQASLQDFHGDPTDPVSRRSDPSSQNNAKGESMSGRAIRGV